MPRAGFEPAIPMFERPKTVLALDSAAIETGVIIHQIVIFFLVVKGNLTLMFISVCRFPKCYNFNLEQQDGDHSSSCKEGQNGCQLFERETLEFNFWDYCFSFGVSLCDYVKNSAPMHIMNSEKINDRKYVD
jgi:hypothetical protein